MDLENNTEKYNQLNGIIRRHFGINNETRHTSNNALQMGNLTEDMKKYQTKWLEQEERVSPERLTWQAYFYTPAGTCDLGRPRTRWKQQFQ
jgi:hypothetical protein